MIVESGRGFSLGYFLKVYLTLLKTGSLDNAIREFSSAKPSWYMSHYTMIYKNGERKRNFLGLFVFIESSFLYFGGVFNKTIMTFALVGYLSSHIQRVLME